MNARPSRDVAWTIALVALAALLVSRVRGPLYDINRQAGAGSDLYELPPPRQVSLLSLGYRAALADLLWSHILVSQGLHVEQRLRYENVPRLLETVNELDPTFRDPYLFAETLITFQVGKTPEDDVRAARAILERGVRERPLDGDIWLAAGEFLAYIAPGTYLTDPAEQEAWREAGARMLAHAAELGGDMAAWNSLGGAAILTRNGERDAAIRFLRRTLAVTDDPELQQSIRAHLVSLLGEDRDEAYARVDAAILAARRKDLTQVSRSLYLLLGPARDAAACAGPDRSPYASAVPSEDLACVTTWRQWDDAAEAARADTAP